MKKSANCQDCVQNNHSKEAQRVLLLGFQLQKFKKNLTLEGGQQHLFPGQNFNKKHHLPQHKKRWMTKAIHPKKRELYRTIYSHSKYALQHQELLYRQASQRHRQDPAQSEHLHHT